MTVPSQFDIKKREEKLQQFKKKLNEDRSEEHTSELQSQ